MGFNERFVAGRLKPRRLRKPLLDGWLCDEHQTRPPERVELPLAKIDQDTLALPIPGEHDLARLSPEATAIAMAHEDVELLLGWPEVIVVVRRGGAVLYAEGDVVHFGEFALDPDSRIARTGYEYLSNTGIEVAVELALTSGEETRAVMLDPGEREYVGHYDIEHDHSYDPSDRPSGVRHHGYFLRVRRQQNAPAVPPEPVAPHPLDLERPGDVVAIARQRGLLEPDEALWAEPEVFSKLMLRYEGPRQNLENEIRQAGDNVTTLARLGEVLVAESAHVHRGDHGEPLLGRASVAFEPTGQMRVEHAEGKQVPGRLRRASRTDSSSS